MFDVDSPYDMTQEQVESFRRRGFVNLKEVLTPETLAYYGEEITRKVDELNTNMTPLEERSTRYKAFIQIINLWQKSEIVRAFVFGKRLARIATELLGTRGVRIYHDQALYKEPYGGFTPWHADEFYWPFTTAKCCSAWVPLQETSLEMGPLGFAEGSHTFEGERNHNISDESESAIQAALSKEGFRYVCEPYELGEVSFHWGWTYHRADGNTTDRPRKAMTVIYMDIDMRMSEESNEYQQAATWCPGVKVGEVIDTPQTPVLYQKAKGTTEDALRFRLGQARGLEDESNVSGMLAETTGDGHIEESE